MSSTDPLIDALVARFPRLFRGKPPRDPSSIPEGWEHLVGRLFEDLDAMLDNRHVNMFKVIQIKEKFASLRVYWSLGTQEMTVLDLMGTDGAQRLNLHPFRPTTYFARVSARVQEAEKEAACTCQNCGRPNAKALPGGWMVALCDRCRADEPRGAS